MQPIVVKTFRHPQVRHRNVDLAGSSHVCSRVNARPMHEHGDCHTARRVAAAGRQRPTIPVFDRQNRAAPRTSARVVMHRHGTCLRVDMTTLRRPASAAPSCQEKFFCLFNLISRYRWLLCGAAFYRKRLIGKEEKSGREVHCPDG